MHSDSRMHFSYPSRNEGCKCRATTKKHHFVGEKNLLERYSPDAPVFSPKSRSKLIEKCEQMGCLQVGF